ncbi:MAG: ATP-binding cassette domain-containing protein [Spirochaetaceae bacterium]|jgi:ABC-type dipeptide/oligopeptide/nickel transport system ATPase component|nr:ATP-binding cassette domain-containing protein [Spirochaetaceae bacterium]
MKVRSGLKPPVEMPNTVSHLSAPPLLEVNNLKASILTVRGRLTAVDGVSLSTRPGEITGIVGESGCGKSVLALSILRLLEHSTRWNRKVKSILQTRISFRCT